MARYDLYKDIAQAGQIAQAYKRNIKTYASERQLELGIPVFLNSNGYLQPGSSYDPIIGIACFSPLLINPEVFYKHREPVSVLTKGRIYVRLEPSSPNVNEFDIAYIDGSGHFTKTAHGKEIGIFLSSATAGNLVILQFDLSTQAVGGL